MATVPTIKVCLLGGGGQGKSALVMKFITGSFLADYDPTIEDTYSKNVTVGNDSALIEILDTAGQEVFWSMQEQWIRDSQIYFLIFNICSRDGFKTTDLLRNKIIEVREKTSNMAIILVGTHSDLSSEREIELDEAQQKATNWDCEYLEVSSLTSENLIQLFNMVLPLYFGTFGGGHGSGHGKSLSLQQEQELELSNSNGLCSCLCGADDNDDLEFDDENEFFRRRKHDNKIQFFKTEELPQDSIPSPILSLKNFRIARQFYFNRFVKAALSGIFIPLIVIFQTIMFLMYSETRNDNGCCGCCWNGIEYDSKSSILLDYLGMVVGRKPGQDPEAIRDRKWFLRQTIQQKWKRIFITIIICLVFIICCYNISQVTKQKGKVSLIETVGPFVLFWIVWLLLSVWIGYDQQLKPSLPKPARLRSLTIFFGEEFSHRSSVYKFVRAYESSRTNNRWKLNKLRTFIVLVLGLLYALTPGLTRVTFGDSSEGIETKGNFFSTDGDIILEIGALIVNFVLISSILYCVEIQYKKQLDNYFQWMTDLTQILHKKEAKRDAFRGSYDQKMVELPSKGSAVSKDLFISMTRRQNALGWLEIRSYLEVQGQVLFGEQELPTTWMIVITCLLVFFTFYRAFFIKGNALESILFNGMAILTIICLIALIRILITAYQFQVLQMSQEKLLYEQKFYMICNRPYDNSILDSHAIGSMERNRSQQSKSKLIQINPLHSGMDSDLIEYENKQENEQLLNQQKTNENENENENENHQIEMTKPKKKTVKIKFDASYENDSSNQNLHSDNDDEKIPLLNIVKHKVIKMDNAYSWSYNVQFVEDLLILVKKKDIFPRLFKLKLNSLLSKIVTVLIIVALVTAFKLYVS